MTGYIRYGTAVKCPVHKQVRDEALKALEIKGVFNKQSILESLNLVAMEGSIRWDYIRRMIEEEFDTELIPISAAFFSTKRARTDLIPNRCIAGGNGRKTAGFASVTKENEAIVATALNLKISKTMGVVQSTEKSIERAHTADIENTREMPKLIA